MSVTLIKNTVTPQSGCMAPGDLDRVIAVAAARYRAMTPADFRRIRREARMGAVRAWIRWILHI